MPKVDINKVQITFKVNRELYKMLERKAKAEGITKSYICSIALENELYREVNIENQQLGALQEIHSMIKNHDRKQDVFSTMFIYFLKYFFTAHQQDFNKEVLGDMNKAFEKGEEQKNTFIKFFKQENKQMTNIIEALLADFVKQEQ